MPNEYVIINDEDLDKGIETSPGERFRDWYEHKTPRPKNFDKEIDLNETKIIHLEKRLIHLPAQWRCFDSEEIFCAMIKEWYPGKRHIFFANNKGELCAAVYIPRGLVGENLFKEHVSRLASRVKEYFEKLDKGENDVVLNVPVDKVLVFADVLVEAYHAGGNRREVAEMIRGFVDYLHKEIEDRRRDKHLVL